MSDREPARLDPDTVRARAYELSQGHESGTPTDNWLRAERELTVAHEYDTVDRDLEHLGMTVARLPLEAGVVWRLSLPRGERVEVWDPGTSGLTLPPEIEQLVGGVVGTKSLVPGPPAGDDPGAARLREMLDEQRSAMLRHDPGARLGEDSENLHQHRVAARRTRAFLRATKAFVDPDWRRSLGASLQALGEATGPVRDLDVLLEHVQDELRDLPRDDELGGRALVWRLGQRRAIAQDRLLAALESDDYRAVLARLHVPPRLAPGVERIRLDRVARKEFDRLARSVKALGKQPEDSALHGLRIQLKRARYAAELAAPRGKAGRKFVAAAKALQDLLGEYQDAVVAEERLRSSAVSDEQTAAAFVAGRIAERQSSRRRRVLEQLPTAWARLRKSSARLHRS